MWAEQESAVVGASWPRELTYKRDPFHLEGDTNKTQYTGGALHAVGGIFMHSSLAVTNEDVPIGLSAAKF